MDPKLRHLIRKRIRNHKHLRKDAQPIYDIERFCGLSSLESKPKHWYETIFSNPRSREPEIRYHQSLINTLEHNSGSDTLLLIYELVKPEHIKNRKNSGRNYIDDTKSQENHMRSIIRKAIRKDGYLIKKKHWNRLTNQKHMWVRPKYIHRSEIQTLMDVRTILKRVLTRSSISQINIMRIGYGREWHIYDIATWFKTMCEYLSRIAKKTKWFTVVYLDEDMSRKFILKPNCIFTKCDRKARATFAVIAKRKRVCKDVIKLILKKV